MSGFQDRFRDRREAGRLLGERVAEAFAGRLPGQPEQRPAEQAAPVVLGLPRGGVPVAAEVAGALGAPLDVLVVRKLGMPGREEVAMGAVGEDGAIVLNPEIVGLVPGDALQTAEDRERAEVEARVLRFREGRPPVPLASRTAIVVDDGVATGATARVACRIARARGADRIVLAVPVAAPEVLAAFPEADETICLHAPRDFMAVGMHYDDFAQTTDAEVVEILRSTVSG